VSVSMMYRKLPNKLQVSHWAEPCLQFPTESCQVVWYVTTSLSGWQHNSMQLLVFINLLNPTGYVMHQQV
jgi:hypothetical protein